MARRTPRTYAVTPREEDISERDDQVTDNMKPEISTVLQDDEREEVVVPVRIRGPVTVHELPADSAMMRGYFVAQATETILSHDRRRKRATVTPTTESVYIGTDINDVSYLVPTNVTATILHTQLVYIRSAHAVNAAYVNLCVENWAD